MEIQQSPSYAQYIKNLKWTVEIVDGIYVYIKPFPLFGSVAKIQRSDSLPKVKNLIPILKKYNIKTLAVEADSSMKQSVFSSWIKKIYPYVRINSDYYLPTKTIRVDLALPHDQIFAQFTDAKRRAVRRAQKYNVSVSESENIDEFLHLKNKSAGFLGFITTHGIKILWNTINKNDKTILLANSPTLGAVGGILLLFHNHIAYYWLAGALKSGKKMFAPTLLVWEALKVSRSRGAKKFDFVGVWDERSPKQNKNWQGFTKFKEGFGGFPVYYPLVPRL